MTQRYLDMIDSMDYRLIAYLIFVCTFTQRIGFMMMTITIPRTRSITLAWDITVVDTMAYLYIVTSATQLAEVLQNSTSVHMEHPVPCDLTIGAPIMHWPIIGAE